MKSSEEYVVTIPVYDKSKLTAMLLYMDNGESNKFEFESVNGIMNKTDNFKTHDVEDLMFVFVQGFIRMHEVQYADQHKSANDWIIHQIKNKNLTSNFKNSCGEFCFDATEIDREPDKYSSTGWSAVLINVEKCIPIDCPPNIDAGPSAPSGGLIITIEVDNNSTGGSSDGDGDGNDDGDNDNKPEPKIKDKECEENNMTSEAVDCINNNTDVVFPCEEGSTQDVLDDIVEGLCTNASSTDGQNSQLEGPQEGEIDCADVNVELDGYDGIELSVFNNFNECLSNEEICELISTNSLSGIGIEKLECLGYPELNDCEIELLANNPHAFDELAENWLQSNLTTNILFGYNDVNECTDAFRHSFFNALNSWKLGENLAREFGEAHECVTTSELASEMDLFNNEVGYNILNQNAFILDQLNNSDIQIQRNGISDLYSVICSALQNGELRVFNDPLSSNPDNDSDVFLITSSDCSCILD